MNIYLSPISMFGTYLVAVSANALVVDGVPHQLADLAEEAAKDEPAMPEWIVTANADSVTLLLPYWGEPSEAVAYPAPIMDVSDGPVLLPA